MKTETLQITLPILSLISEIDECKGAWKALGQLIPEQLTALKRAVTIESIGSPTRMEGSKSCDQQVDLLLSNLPIKLFTTRDEQEVAGSAELMNKI